MPDNVERMFYVGDMPWHRKGIQLDSPPDSWTAINYAGLNWTVEKVKLFSEDNIHVKDMFAIARNDNKKVLGVVGNGYVPLQNSEAFMFFDPLIKDCFLEYETAGSLGDGEVVWILARLKHKPYFEVVKGDQVDKFLLLSNSHNGNSTVNIKFTPIRVVCQNTLTVAINNGSSIKVRHTPGIEKRVEEIRDTIFQINTTYDTIEDMFIRMAQYKMNNDKLSIYFNDIYPVIDGNKIDENQYIKNKINKNIQAQLYQYYESGYGVYEYKIAGTLWAAYNAITQHIDHPKDYKKGDDKLLTRIWFGDGELFKKRALKAAIRLIGAA